MERTLLSWNLPNWITVGIMAFGVYVAVAIAAQVAMRVGLINGQGPSGG